jgi:hypothetical protein
LSDVNANISINFDTGQALASLRQLQAGLSRFNQSLTQGNVAAASAQKGLNDQLMQAINATGKFVATQKDIATSTSSFTSALEKNQLSMREYFRYTAAAATANTKVFKGMFAQEREIINRARKDRVKSLQAQYIQLSDASGNFVKTLQVVPKHLKMVNGEYADYATRTQMAAQRQQFMNQLLKQGSTQLLNFGKNTQWAGRQLMVGLTIPLSILGSTAAKVFMEMEQAVIKFSRVYGDMNTSMADTNQAIENIKLLGKEFTKYGIAVKDTIEMAASAAAMGLSGNALEAQVIQATRLSVLGQVEQQQALETTISLQNAFGISSEQLAEKINFLNAVENQTVLSIEDLTIAIPKAGPVVKQLGGSVEDLAFFMTAMKEGGINASEGANALKSGLASMINPSAKASAFLADLGINIKGIVEANAGNLKGTIIGFAQALDTLDPLNRARAIEQMFGKFQFARLSTLFQNVTKDGSQASRAFGLAGKSVQELAILSERELGKVENATGVKFKKSIEQLKNELVPVGKAFLQAATPIVEFVGKVLAKFNSLSDGTKKTIAIVIGVVGGLAPILLMTFGILMNGVANGIKLFAALRNGIAKLNGQNQVLGGGFDYLTQQQTEALAQTNALHTSHSKLISTFNVEKSSVDSLAAAYGNAASQARALAASSPGLFNAVPGAAGAVSGLPQKPLAFAQGGVVPGRGDKDTVPAMLTPGEVILTKDTVRNNPELVAALQNNSFKKYSGGTGGGSDDIAAELATRFTGAQAPGSDAFKGRMTTLLEGAMSQTQTGLDRVVRFARAAGVEITDANKDQIEYWRKEMLKSVEEAGTALVGQIDLSRDQIKKKLKEMSPTGGQASGLSNTYDLVDSHGSQNLSKTMAHITPKKRMSGSQARQVLDPDSRQSVEILASDMAADYLNNLPDSDARKPKTPIKPEYNVVSGLGMDGVSNKTNKALDLGTQNTKELITELEDIEPVKRWGTLLEQNGMSAEEYGAQVERLDQKLMSLIRTHGKTKATISDSDLSGFMDEVIADPEVSPEMKNAVQRSKNKVTGARATNVSKTDRKKMEDVVRSGEVVVPGLENPETFTVAASGKAQGGESGAARTRGIGFFDPAEEARLAAEAETFSPPKVKATEQDKAEAESEGAEIGKAALRGVRKGATTESPSREGKEVGKDIADGIIIGMQESQPAVESQSARLGDSAVPKRQRTAAETQARVDKMDLDNAAFYSDLDTPEFRDERQVLKSIDRNRRKRGAVRQVADAMPGTEAPSQTAQLTVASSKRVSTATDALAVKTEEAVTAQTQVVQQIKDESRSRVTIKGNTVNVQKAREEADKAENEAAITRARAHALEAEQLKQKKSNSPTTITDEQVLAAKEKANAAELEYAKIRQELAEQGIGAAQPGTIQDPAKAPAKVKKAEEAIAHGTVEQGDGLRRIVEGTDETVKSTTIVAENTDELAGLTGDVLDPQSENLDSVITTAGLNDAIANTTSDLQSSTLDSAISQEELTELQKEEQFLRQKLNNNLVKQNLAAEQATSQTNGNIPSTYIDKDQALLEAYGDGTAENPGFTQDGNGQILLDPETKQPTTMSKKQVKQKARGLRREKVSKFSGKASGALGVATMVSGAVGAPPQVTAALGAMSTIAQFAPMLAGMGPAGWVAAGVVAVGASVYLFNKHMSDAAKKAAKFVDSVSATTRKMVDIGKATGKVGSSELMARKNKTLFQDYNTVGREGRSFGNKFLKQDVGKTMQKALKENITKNGNEKAAKDFARELSFYVSDGLMSAEEAHSVAEQIGVNLKNTTLGLNIKANIISLIGPGGEDLIKDPVQGRIDLVKSAAYESAKYADRFNPDTDGGTQGWDLGYDGVSGTEAATLVAMDSNVVAMAQAQADAIQRIYEDEKAKLEVELASTTNAQKKLEIQEKITALGDQNVIDSARMNNEVALQIAKAEQNFRDNIHSGGWISYRESGAFDASRGKVTDTYANTGSATAAKDFLDRSDDFGDYTSGFTDSKTAQTFQYKMEMMVGNKIISPEQANAMLDTFAGSLPELDAVINLGIKKFGAPKLFAMMDLFSNFTNKELGKQFIIDIVRKNPEEFEATAKTIAALQAINNEEINIEVVLTNIGVPGLDLLQKRLDAIAAWKPEEITIDFVTNYLEGIKMNSPQVQAMMESEWFKNAKPGEKAQIIQRYVQYYTSYASIDPATAQALAEEKARNKMFEETGYYNSTDGAWVSKYNTYVTTYKTEILDVQTRAASATTDFYNKPGGPGAATPPPTTTPPAKKERDTTYDDLLKRLRNVRNAAIDAAKGVKELNLALLASGSKSVKDRFVGISQQLRAKGVNEEFIEYLKGLDTADLKKFAFVAKEAGSIKYTEKVGKRNKDGSIAKDKNGKVIMVNKVQKYEAGDLVLTDKGNQYKRGTEKAIMGELQESQLKSLRNMKDQEIVQRKLRALKYDELTIERILSDESAVQIIAAGQHTAEELKLTAGLAKEAALREKINGLIATGADAQKLAANIKRAPEVKKFFGEMESKGIKLSPAAMQGMLTDAAQLEAAISAMDLYGLSAEDALSKLQQMAAALNAIKENSNIQLAMSFAAKDAFGQVQDGKAAAERVMAVRRTAYNNMTPDELKKVNVTNARTGVVTAAGSLGYASAVKNKFGDAKTAAALEASIAGKSLAGVQKERKTLGERSAVAGAVANVSAGALSSAQAELSRLQEGISETINSINKKYDAIIKGQQASMDALNKTLNDKFEKQMKLKQERVSVLSNDLTLMDKQAESINEKYDAQVTALQEVQKVQEAITAQQQQQLGLADALTQGDLAAAAKAIQDIRASQAEQYSGGQFEALDLSRKNELDSLKGPESGLTRKQITEEQFQIQQDLYKLETSPERKKILEDIEKLSEAIAKNDENRANEIAAAEASLAAQITAQEEIVKNLKITADADAKITAELAQQDAELAKQETALAAIVDSVVDIDDSTGLTLEDWEKLADKVLDSEGLMQDIAMALLAGEKHSAAMAKSWGEILDTLNNMPKSFTTTQFMNTVNTVTTVHVGSTGPTSSPTPTSTSTPKPTESAAVVAARKIKDDAQLELDTANKNLDDAENKGEWYKFSSLMAATALAKEKLKNANIALDAAIAAAAAAEAATPTPTPTPAASTAASSGGGNKAVQMIASGGIVNPMRFAMGGFAKGSDTVPAMLTPGEFVMSKYAVQSHGISNMKAINSGDPIGGDSVYNYSVNVAVQSDANPDEIARAVMRQIRQVDSQRITGNRN